MTVAHPGDNDVEAASLLRDPDTYSLDSWDETIENETRTAPLVKEKSGKYVQHKIKAIYPALQHTPRKWLERRLPSSKLRIAVLLLAGLLWTSYMVTLVVRVASVPDIEGYGEPRRLTCYSNAFGNIVERSAIPSCDTHDPDCITFIPPPFAFRCPPDCASAHLQEEHYLGNELIDHRIWVIGGANDSATSGTHYRADSYICGAALHAGVISDKRGGCGILTLTTGGDSYVGSKSNGIDTMSFSSSFPLSFSVLKAEKASWSCYDAIWFPFTVSVLFTVGISLLTTSTPVFFCSVYTVVFFQTALITDAPNFENYLQTVQVAFGRFLPAAFVGFAIYKFCARQTLLGHDAPFERTILWVGGCWLGSVDNYTLDRLPLSRLTPRDLREPGAIIVLICVVGAIVTAAGTQTWAFWRDGRFWKYLSIYGLMILTIVVLALVPGLNLRIHHYILALLLLPGTAIQTRPSLLFQGFLLGLFINGVARWGFASILETNRFLAREGQLGSEMPNFLGPFISNATHISFEFSWPSSAWDGISVIVNDVERTRIGRTAAATMFDWVRTKSEDAYFRFAYVRSGYVNGLWVGDYTKPGTWGANGTWTMTD